jgi:hypothetical protein
MGWQRRNIFYRGSATPVISQEDYFFLGDFLAAVFLAGAFAAFFFTATDFHLDSFVGLNSAL